MARRRHLRKRRGSFRIGAVTARRVNAERLQLPVQRRALHADKGRRARNVAAKARDLNVEIFPLEALARVTKRQTDHLLQAIVLGETRLRPSFRRQRIDGHRHRRIAARQNEDALNHVAQLAHIARPVSRLQRRQRIFADLTRRHTGHAGQTAHEIARKFGNIFPALSDARRAERHDVETVEEVFAEVAFGNITRKVARTRRHNAHIHLHVIGAVQALETLIHQHAQNLRLCLNRPALFREQLRAILRAGAQGNLRIMFPMVGDIEEFRQARRMLDALQTELNVAPVTTGIMIEVPSAALMADVLAREVDFFSIGTNDLTQYTLAMDRAHPALASKQDGLHPAVLRLIAKTIDGAHKHGKWVGICGELGSDPAAVPILIGLGIDELSVNVPSIPLVKAQIRGLKASELQGLAQQALDCSTAREVRELVKRTLSVS